MQNPTTRLAAAGCAIGDVGGPPTTIAISLGMAGPPATAAVMAGAGVGAFSWAALSTKKSAVRLRAHAMSCEPGDVKICQQPETGLLNCSVYGRTAPHHCGMCCGMETVKEPAAFGLTHESPSCAVVWHDELTW